MSQNPPTLEMFELILIDQEVKKQLFIYLCIHSSYEVFVFGWLYKDTTPSILFKYSQLLKITNIKIVVLLVLAR